MNVITKLKYITVYINLNSIGFYLAFQNWWLKESASPIAMGFILLCFGICWCGIRFLAIMISQLIFLKQDNIDFVSPISLATKEDYVDNFGDDAKKMKKSILIINFGIFILSIFIFVSTMNYIKKNQLEKFGVIENVRVIKKSKDVKGNEYSSVEYNNGKSGSILLTKSLEDTQIQSVNEGDSIKIIYSLKNPDIVEIYSNYKK